MYTTGGVHVNLQIYPIEPFARLTYMSISRNLHIRLAHVSKHIARLDTCSACKLLHSALSVPIASSNILCVSWPLFVCRWLTALQDVASALALGRPWPRLEVSLKASTKTAGM